MNIFIKVVLKTFSDNFFFCHIFGLFLLTDFSLDSWSNCPSFFLVSNFLFVCYTIKFILFRLLLFCLLTKSVKKMFWQSLKLLED